ncbi:MAG: hypothetical protein FWC47_16065 [Oscillospiraceae bacterium]|nr:hypothetical protein [Oscillospiraceae bacterium]
MKKKSLALFTAVIMSLLLTMTVGAANITYTMKNGEAVTLSTSKGNINAIKVTLTGKDENNNTVTAYAYCANMDLPCKDGDKYQMVSASTYLAADKYDQIKAALTYVLNNYKNLTAIEMDTIVQGIVWKITNGYTLNSVSSKSSNNAAINAALVKQAIDDGIAHIGDITNDYKTGVTMMGNGTAVTGTLCTNYGPYNVSDNTILANVYFNLTVNNSNVTFVNESGETITKVLPGQKFYVCVPDGVSGDFSFTATASLDQTCKYVKDLNYFLNISDVSTGKVIYQPLFQPLVELLIDQKDKTYLYECSGSFSVKKVEQPKPPEKHDSTDQPKPPEKHDSKDQPKQTAKLGPKCESVTVTNKGNVPTIKKGLNSKNGNPYYGDKKIPDTPYVVPNSNHFVYAKFNRSDLAKGCSLDFVEGNKYDICGSGSVKLVGNNLVITIDKFGSGSFGAVAFNKLPVFKNGNIHSQKQADLTKLGAMSGFNHDNKLTIPCPAGDTIYLYMHCDTIQFYQ